MNTERSHVEKRMYVVNVLGIVYNPKTKKILIGKRENDPFVKELGWSFPGGRLHHGKAVKDSLRLEVKKKTGISIRAKQLLLARIPPEQDQFLLLYYSCETQQTKSKAGEKFVEVKWIKPKEWKKYFMTSIHPAIKRFLERL